MIDKITMLALSLISTLALLASTAGLFLMAHATKGFTLRTPSGPDAMGIVVFFFLSIAHWLLTLLACILVASRGVFAWLATPPFGAVVVTGVITLALGALSFLAMIFSLERKPTRTPAGWAGAFALPLAVNAYLLALAWTDPADATRALWPRFAGAPFALLALASILLLITLALKAQAASADRLAADAARTRAQEEQNRLDALARDARHKSELDALPDDAPLTTFVTHLFIDKSDAHHTLALARIASLPSLAARFAEELTHPDPLQREYLLNYFRVAPTIDPALVAAMRPHIAACFTRLAADYDAARQQQRTDDLRHVRGMVLGLLLTAQRFPPRFDDPARQLRAALDRWTGPSREETLAILDRYLAGETISSD